MCSPGFRKCWRAFAPQSSRLAEGYRSPPQVAARCAAAALPSQPPSAQVRSRDVFPPPTSFPVVGPCGQQDFLKGEAPAGDSAGSATGCTRCRHLSRRVPACWRGKLLGNPEVSPKQTSTPETIRTSDLRFRKALLYPAELRGRIARWRERRGLWRGGCERSIQNRDARRSDRALTNRSRSETAHGHVSVCGQKLRLETNTRVVDYRTRVRCI